MASFAGYNFTPVSDIPSSTEWEFSATGTYTATANSNDNVADEKMLLSSVEEYEEMNGEYLFSSVVSPSSLISPSSSSSPSTPAVAPSSSYKVVTPSNSSSNMSNMNSNNSNNMVVFGPHWMDMDESQDEQGQVQSIARAGGNLLQDYDEAAAVAAAAKAAAVEDEEEDYFNTNHHNMQRPLEELFNNALYFDNDEDRRHYHHHHDTIHDAHGFLAPLLNHVPDPMDYNSLESFNIGLPLEERYQLTLNKLEESMKRSQETRNCLTMQTCTINQESYDRSGTIKELLSSITTSSNQVQKYVTSISQKQRQSNIV